MPSPAVVSGRDLSTIVAGPALATNGMPLLSDVSPKDKPWDKHRANADTIARYYSYGGLDQYSDRVTLCSQMLGFGLAPADAQDDLKLKLRTAHFCRVRHCPVCQWRRSLMWQAKAYDSLPKVIEDYPKYRWLFVTLTLRNCELLQLRSTLDHINQSFQRLTKRKIWPGVGWIKSVEVTRGNDGNSAHPHLHCLIMVKSSFFTHSYIKKKRWIELWQSCLKVDYKPILDVQSIKSGQSPVVLLGEVLKYQTKESDLVADPEWFLEYVKQLYKTRAIAVGGVLRKYMKQVEEEPEDLIGEEEDNQGGLDNGELWFGWRRQEKRYRMVDRGGS